MNGHSDPGDSFEPEVRASFHRHLDDLDRRVPARPPARSWFDRAQVNGTVARQVATDGVTRRRRATAPQLAAALAGVAGFAVLALIANLALRAAQPTPTAGPTPTPGPTPVMLAPFQVASFGDDGLTGLVLGPDGGGAYTIDGWTSYVYRIDLATGEELSVAVVGQQPYLPPGTAVVGYPTLLAAGGGDVLILDEKNQLWRWREVPGRDGLGTLLRLHVEDSATWGEVRAIGTLVTNPSLGMFTLFVVDSSAGQVLEYPESADGTGYYAESRSFYLVGEGHSMAKVDDMYIDGSVYLADGGVIDRYDLGQLIRGWSAEPPPGEPRPHYTKLAADSPIKDEGNLYAFDSAGRRVVVVQKRNGQFVGQFALPADLSDLKGMFVRPGANGSDPTLYWVSGGRLLRAVLPGVASFVPPTPPASLPAGFCPVGATPCA